MDAPWWKCILISALPLQFHCFFLVISLNYVTLHLHTIPDTDDDLWVWKMTFCFWSKCLLSSLFSSSQTFPERLQPMLLQNPTSQGASDYSVAFSTATLMHGPGARGGGSAGMSRTEGSSLPMSLYASVRRSRLCIPIPILSPHRAPLSPPSRHLRSGAWGLTWDSALLVGLLVVPSAVVLCGMPADAD